MALGNGQPSAGCDEDRLGLCLLPGLLLLLL